jgi:Apea-like HEPN
MRESPDDAADIQQPLGVADDLRPNESIQKILISASGRFTGEFVSQNLLLTHAWPPFHTGRRDWFREDTPLSRTALMLSFRTIRSPQLAGHEIPNYEPAGHIVSSVLSVLFGKRFDTHGPVEMSGSFGAPDLSQFAIPNNRALPHNSQRGRVDYPVPLEVGEAKRVQMLFLGDHLDEKSRKVFLTAARFYQRALQAVEDDPEVAYLHLITAGEIIATHKTFDEDNCLDKKTLEVLARIQREMEGGDRVVRYLRGQLRGIKRRFVSAIVSYIRPDFFDRREAEQLFDALSKRNLNQRIGAAYDLRSKYVHGGRSFGRLIAPRSGNAEIQSGKPVIEGDSKFANIVHLAPLFGGLERIIRCALLGFAQELGADLSGLGAPPTTPTVDGPVELNPINLS